MANELTITCDVKYQDLVTTNELALLGAQLSIVSTSTLFTRIEMSIALTETTLVLGGLTTLGYSIFVNRDSTNTVYIKNVAAGSRIIQCDPGIPQAFKFGPDITAPVAIALVAACKLEYLIAQN